MLQSRAAPGLLTCYTALSTGRKHNQEMRERNVRSRFANFAKQATCATLL